MSNRTPQQDWQRQDRIAKRVGYVAVSVVVIAIVVLLVG